MLSWKGDQKFLIALDELGVVHRISLAKIIKERLYFMKVFTHHIYEYKKGLRNLVLHTMQASLRPEVEYRLERSGIAYQIYPLGNAKINVFFGADECVEVIRRIGKKSLKSYTPEEDYILGIMLGYDRLKQCHRYLQLLDETRPSVGVEEVMVSA